MYYVHASLSVVNHWPGCDTLGFCSMQYWEVEIDYNSLVLLKVKILNWGNDCFVFVVYDYRFKCARWWSWNFVNICH